MRKLSSAVLIAMLSSVLIGAPLTAAPAGTPAIPLGVILSAENANVAAGVTNSGATVYDGDRLTTPTNASLRARLGSGQIILRQSTSADVHALPNGFLANLNSGTVVVSSPEGQTFELIADGATIRPATAQPTSGQVTMMSPKELVLTATRGTLEISMGDEVKTLEAGSSYRLEVEADDTTSDPQIPRPTARNRFLWIAIPAVGAVTAVVVWRALVSPTAP